MQIYLNTADLVLISDYRKQHLVLNEKSLKKIENGNDNAELEIEENGGNNYIQLKVDLACLFNNTHFYNNFYKGFLLYLKLSLEKNYLSQYIQKEYIKNLNNSKYYYNNFTSV